MTIKIEIQSTTIPVVIGHLKFEVNTSDETYGKFLPNFNQFLNLMKEMDIDNLTTEEDEKNFEEMKKAMEQSYDTLLEKGAYEKIYKVMPNSAMLTGCLIGIANQVDKTINKRTEAISLPPHLRQKQQKYNHKKKTQK